MLSIIQLHWIKRNDPKMTIVQMAEALDTTKDRVYNMLTGRSRTMPSKLSGNLFAYVESQRHRTRLLDVSLLLPHTVSLIYRFAFYQAHTGWIIMDDHFPPVINEDATGLQPPFGAPTYCVRLHFMKIPEPVDPLKYYRRNMESRLWEISDLSDKTTISPDLVEKYHEEWQNINPVRIKFERKHQWDRP